MNVSVHQTESLLVATLLQILVMIGAARVGNTLLRRLGQPGVVGEIIAGLLLGPSLFGHFFPAASVALFVIMAIVTTVMTAPLLKRLLPRAGHAVTVEVEA